MDRTDKGNNLTDILDAIEAKGQDAERISLDAILDAIGRRSFGPIVMIIGLFLVVPGLSDIPTVPSLMGILLVLLVGQLAFHREHIWLPGWLLRRSVKERHLRKTLSYARRPAAFIDRISGERLTFLVRNPITRVLSAILCVTFAFATPFMEVVPFSANVAGLSIFLLGLALTAVDGLILVLALTLYLSTAALIIVAVI